MDATDDMEGTTGSDRSRMNLEDYFSRINYEGSTVKCDFQTLKGIFQQHIRTFPFENFSLHCGETVRIEIEAIYNKFVRNRRGGTCVQNNSLLYWVLKTMGYVVTMHGGNVYLPDKKNYNSLMSHLVLRVVVDGKPYLVDASFGSSYQMWEPILLVSGQEYPQVPGIFCLKEVNQVWYLDQFKRKKQISNKCVYPSDLLNTSKVRKLYSFTLIERTVEDFRLSTIYMQTSPESHLLKTTICTLQLTDGFRALIGWTFSETKYNYKDNMDLIEFMDFKKEELDMVLKDKFNIILENKIVPMYIKTLFTL